MELSEMTLRQKVELYQAADECYLPLVPVTIRNPNPKHVLCRVIGLIPGFKALKIELLNNPNRRKSLLVSPRVLDYEEGI